MGRNFRALLDDGVSNETIEKRSVDENTYPENDPLNFLINNTLGNAAKTIDPYSGYTEKLLEKFKHSQADINDNKAAFNDERIDEEMLDPNSPRSQAMLDMAMSMPALGTTRTVKEMVKRFGPEVGEIIGKEIERRAKNIYGSAHNDKHLANKIMDLAAAQRYGGPEDAMLRVQRTLGGGRLDPSIEHIGDLTHRLHGGFHSGDLERRSFSKMGEYDFGAAKGKMRDGFGIKNLEYEYPVMKEHNENVENNYRYFKNLASEGTLHKDATLTNLGFNEKTTLPEFKKMVDDSLKNYAEQHAKIPSYNEAGWLAREAAVNLGKKDPDKSLSQLRRLSKMTNHGRKDALNKLGKAERTPDNNELLSRLGAQYPEKAEALQGNKLLQNILDWNSQKKFDNYINPHDENIQNINLLKDLKKSPQTWEEFIQYYKTPSDKYDSGAFKNVYAPENSDKVIKRFRPESYVDMLPAAMQEQLVFNKLGDISPKTKTYKTSENIFQVQDKVNPLNKVTNDPSEWGRRETDLARSISKKAIEPKDLHPANHGVDKNSKSKVFDVGMFEKVNQADNNQLDQLDDTFKTLPSDRFDFLNELFKLKAGK